MPARNVAGKSEWDSTVFLAGQEGLKSFVLQLFLYFRLDNGTAIMFLFKKPLSFRDVQWLGLCPLIAEGSGPSLVAN